jgi:hypothetical protein
VSIIPAVFAIREDESLDNRRFPFPFDDEDAIAALPTLFTTDKILSLFAAAEDEEDDDAEDAADEPDDDTVSDDEELELAGFESVFNVARDTVNNASILVGDNSSNF